MKASNVLFFPSNIAWARPSLVRLIFRPIPYSRPRGFSSTFAPAACAMIWRPQQLPKHGTCLSKHWCVSSICFVTPNSRDESRLEQKATKSDEKQRKATESNEDNTWDIIVHRERRSWKCKTIETWKVAECVGKQTPHYICAVMIKKQLWNLRHPQARNLHLLGKRWSLRLWHHVGQQLWACSCRVLQQ